MHQELLVGHVGIPQSLEISRAVGRERHRLYNSADCFPSRRQNKQTSKARNVYVCCRSAATDGGHVFRTVVYVGLRRVRVQPACRSNFSCLALPITVGNKRLYKQRGLCHVTSYASCIATRSIQTYYSAMGGWSVSMRSPRTNRGRSVFLKCDRSH